ncbi:hypothetical protein MKX01_005682 [Papaver californicum]|nr:hypothetical protein MKX01_005682 [Papaver californicum]
MKYEKILSNQLEETLPDWEDKYLSYKELKKRLDDDEVDDLSRHEEMDFIRFLEAELEKFNWFFLDKEQDYIIGSKELQDIVAKTRKSSNDEELIMKARKDVLDFRRKMVLLDNYSALNYTIHVNVMICFTRFGEDTKEIRQAKRRFIRFSFIQKVSQQPFVTTNLLNDLLRYCEMILNHLFSMTEPSVTSKAVHNENAICATRHVTTSAEKESVIKGGGEKLIGTEYIESLYLRRTLSALRALKEIRSGSKTKNVFSLPLIV